MNTIFTMRSQANKKKNSSLGLSILLMMGGCSYLFSSGEQPQESKTSSQPMELVSNNSISRVRTIEPSVIEQQPANVSELSVTDEPPPPALTETVSGLVLSVYGNSSFSFRPKSGPTQKIRIQGIPSEITKGDLKNKIWQQNVELSVNGEDKFGYQIATVFIAGTNVNEALTDLANARQIQAEKQRKEDEKRLEKERQMAARSYWLNTSSNTRHNAGCKHYRSTKSGRPCSAGEGKACGICGG